MCIIKCFNTVEKQMVRCIYGGPTYPLHPQLQGPLKNQNLTPQQADFNNSISALRTLVE